MCLHFVLGACRVKFAHEQAQPSPVVAPFAFSVLWLMTYGVFAEPWYPHCVVQRGDDAFGSFQMSPSLRTNVGLGDSGSLEVIVIPLSQRETNDDNPDKENGRRIIPPYFAHEALPNIAFVTAKSLW